MTNVLLYWNHICVLHNQEKAFLSRLAESLKAEEIALTVRYFGLGYPEHMSEYLAREDAVLPDLIVSADLEVFEDARLMESCTPRCINRAISCRLPTVQRSPAVSAARRFCRFWPFRWCISPANRSVPSARRFAKWTACASAA